MFFEMVEYSTIVLWVQTYNLIFAKPVESEEKALEVGKFIAHQLYDGTNLVDFDKYEETPQVYDDGKIYSVCYSLLNKNRIIPDHVSLPEGNSIEHVVYTLGGGGPCIEIEKATGKILDWKLQK